MSGSGAPADLDVRLRSDDDAARAGRVALESWLASHGLDAIDVMSLVHAATELVINAAEHAPTDAAAPVDIRLAAAMTPGGEVVIDVRDNGRWRTPVYDVGRGRGLAMAAGLAHHLDVTTGESGTHAQVRYRPSPRVTPGQGLSHVEVVEPGPRRLRLSGVLANDDVELLTLAIDRASRAGNGTVEVDLLAVTALSPLVLEFLAGVRAGAGDTDPGSTVVLRVRASSVPHVELDRAGIPCVVAGA